MSQHAAQNVFLTEVSVPDANMPGKVVSQQINPQRYAGSEPGSGALLKNNPSRYLVQNIYDFPSVQSLKVENGTNMPFRYKMRDSGRAPLWRSYQGKKLTHQSKKMCAHHMIFTGIPQTQRDDANTFRREQCHRLPMVERRRSGATAPDAPHSSADAADTAERAAMGGAQSHPAPSVAAYQSSALSQPSSRRRRQSDERTSVVSSQYVAPADSLLPVSSGGGGAARLPERLSKACVDTIRAQPNVLVPNAPPASDAPEPVSSSPVASVAASHISAYDNLTSVSLRTPQSLAPTQPSACTSHVRHDISQLASNLKKEASQKETVKKELLKLKQRQAVLLKALTEQQRSLLKEKMKEEGLES